MMKDSYPYWRKLVLIPWVLATTARPVYRKQPYRIELDDRHRRGAWLALAGIGAATYGVVVKQPASRLWGFFLVGVQLLWLFGLPCLMRETLDGQEVEDGAALRNERGFPFIMRYKASLQAFFKTTVALSHRGKAYEVQLDDFYRALISWSILYTYFYQLMKMAWTGEVAYRYDWEKWRIVFFFTLPYVFARLRLKIAKNEKPLTTIDTKNR